MTPEQLQLAYNILESQIDRDTEYKACFYDDCTSKAIRAHSIQNNRILTRIAVSGQVLSVSPKVDGSEDMSIDLVEVGRAKASTFFGFCNEHDTRIFLPIESADYVPGNEEQQYLFAYRALAKEYNTKYRVQARYRKLLQMSTEEFAALKTEAGLPSGNSLDSMRPFLDAMLLATSESIEKLECLRVMMNVNLDRRRFSKVETQVMVWPEEYHVAVSSGMFIKQDLEGNVINDLAFYQDPKPLFLTIFPQGGKTYVLFSYFKKHGPAYSLVLQRILAANFHFQRTIVSNIVAQYVENLFFSPDRWGRLPDKQKSDFIRLFERTLADKGRLVVNDRLDLFV